MFAAPSVTASERALAELWLWLARSLQYSADHPACRDLAVKAHASVTQALAATSPLVVGAVKDDVVVDGISSTHPAIRTRVGPCLHERGVMVLRLLRGVTLEELSSLVEILRLPAQTVFDRGGVTRLAMDAGLGRVQIEELAHDVTAEEREAQRRRTKLRGLFKEVLLELLARRVVDASVAEHIVELLEHPDIAVAILEAEPAGVPEAAAGLALMVRQEEERGGLPLADKLRAVLLTLTPRSRDKLLLGFPTLVDEFRAALKWAFDGFSDRDLATMWAPTVRAHAGELDVALYAISAATPHQAKRMSALRWVGTSFFDWPADDTPSADALAVLARPVEDYCSFWSERDALRAAATEALAASTRLADVAPRPVTSPPPESLDAKEVLPAFDGQRSLAEVIHIATRTRSFERFCEGLPAAAAAILSEGANAAVIGVLRGLAEVTDPEQREAAARAQSRVAAASAQSLLRDLEAESARVEGNALEPIAFMVKLLGAAAPAAVLERLDESDNRKMRRILLDALPHDGHDLLALVRPRLRSERWYVVRNAVLLLSRIGGTAKDLEVVHRHPDERVRLEVVRALRAMQADEAVTSLIVRLISDASAEVCGNARLLLRGELLSADAIAELQRVVADETRPDDVRTSGLAALGGSPRDEAAQALFDLLHPTGLIEAGAATQMRDRAAVALQRCPASAAGELFARGLASSVRRVRRACEHAAGLPR